MHGRIWFVPLLVFLWLLPSPFYFSSQAPVVQAATTGDSPSPATSTKPSKKKRAAATKAKRVKPPANPARRSRSTQRNPRGSPGDDQPEKNASVRRYSSQNAMLRRLAVAGLLRSPNSQEPRLLETWKIRLVDGDTFWYGSERIRVRGYDAPELSQPGGFDSTRRLEALLHEGEVRMYPHGLDVYGRTLADVYVERRNVAEVMIEEGYTKKR